MGLEVWFKPRALASKVWNPKFKPQYHQKISIYGLPLGKGDWFNCIFYTWFAVFLCSVNIRLEARCKVHDPEFKPQYWPLQKKKKKKSRLE
jgi:hypothetical protein